MTAPINVNKDHLSYRIIDSPSGLQKAAQALKGQLAIAVDLEADSMYHYKEKVCLIQIASKKLNIVIDPLSIKDMSPIAHLFLSRHIKKVFHGSDYDVRSLYRDFKIKINNLFDTQAACKFLGAKETGLEAVIRNTFNICLDKKYQKKDWSKRPLPKDMADYAIRDALYLLPLSEILQTELEKKGRLSWVIEECEYLSRVRPGLSDGSPMFLKFKGAGRFKPRGLAVLEALLRFRANIAEKKDKPVFRIFSNDSLLKTAAVRPTTLRRLKTLDVFSKKQIGMYGDELIQVINAALRIPENKLPVYPCRQNPILSPEIPARVKALKARRDAIARSLGIDPTLLCNKSLLYAVAIRNPLDPEDFNDMIEMKTWQKNVFGHDAVDVLQRLNRGKP